MAGVKGSVVCSVVLAADWFTVGVVVDVEETFEQLPSLLGRQLEHCFPAFTQAQPLHEPCTYVRACAARMRKWKLDGSGSAREIV